MTRRPAADMVDRLAAMVTGLLVASIGGGAVLWPTGLLADVPDVITVEPLIQATTSGWWPWALAGTAIILTSIALAWLLLHLPTRATAMLRVPGDCGTLTIDLHGVAAAAAESLTGHPGVRSAQARVLTEHAVRTLAFTVTLAHPDELSNVLAAMEATCAHIRHVCADPNLAARTVIELPKHSNRPGKRLIQPVTSKGGT